MFVLLSVGFFGLFTIIWVVRWVLCLFAVAVTDRCSPHNSLLFRAVKTNSRLISDKASAIEAESHGPFSQAEGCIGSATVRLHRSIHGDSRVYYIQYLKNKSLVLECVKGGFNISDLHCNFVGPQGHIISPRQPPQILVSFALKIRRNRLCLGLFLDFFLFWYGLYVSRFISDLQTLKRASVFAGFD